MRRKNEFENLVVREPIKDKTPLHTEFMTIYDTKAESAIMSISTFEGGKYAYGYDIHFVTGEEAHKEPGDVFGWFRSARDAKTYFLGHILCNREMFSSDFIAKVKHLMIENIQLNLFTDLQD